VIVPEEDWNRAYYGQSLTAENILRTNVSDGKADTLKSTLSGR
jgi:lipid-binding SYLF domain-containing protein